MVNAADLIVYIDMDGVLVQYERAAYTGPDPQYCRPGFHYFRHLKPDYKMIATIEKLQKNPKVEVKILTSVSNIGSLFLEQTEDKILWLNKHCPFIDTDTQFIASASSKRAIAEALCTTSKVPVFQNFGINHILIDDYNKNLEDWTSAGGTGIKYINGLNDPTSYKGLILDSNMTSDDITNLITKHINYLRRDNKIAT